MSSPGRLVPGFNNSEPLSFSHVAYNASFSGVIDDVTVTIDYSGDDCEWGDTVYAIGTCGSISYSQTPYAANGEQLLNAITAKIDCLESISGPNPTGVCHQFVERRFPIIRWPSVVPEFGDFAFTTTSQQQDGSIVWSFLEGMLVKHQVALYEDSAVETAVAIQESTDKAFDFPSTLNGVWYGTPQNVEPPGSTPYDMVLDLDIFEGCGKACGTVEYPSLSLSAPITFMESIKCDTHIAGEQPTGRCWHMVEDFTEPGSSGTPGGAPSFLFGFMTISEQANGCMLWNYQQGVWVASSAIICKE
jgi:hypothetical protein